MKDFLNKIDNNAKLAVKQYLNKNLITSNVISFIIELYNKANEEKQFNSERFESAYHNSITSYFEFYFARILYHISENRKYGWKIYLRRQIGKSVPDIRLEKNGVTIVIIEIKVKGGWIQPFFSKERYNCDKIKFNQNKSKSNPKDIVNNILKQIKKYRSQFGNKIEYFMIMPTLSMVHRNKYKSKYSDYKNRFSKLTKLSKSNFVLMSKN